MRTTLTLDDDPFQAAKAKATHEQISLAKAVSELIPPSLATMNDAYLIALALKYRLKLATLERKLGDMDDLASPLIHVV